MTTKRMLRKIITICTPPTHHMIRVGVVSKHTAVSRCNSDDMSSQAVEIFQGKLTTGQT